MTRLLVNLVNKFETDTPSGVFSKIMNDNLYSFLPEHNKYLNVFAGNARNT